jgi:hypothetical protein
MNVVLENLIESLRNELQQYGEMLALLDHQQELVALQRTEDILQSLSAIDIQSAAIQAARANRQLAQHNLAEKLEPGVRATFVSLIPKLPEPYRPLVTALVQENNELLMRVRQRAQQSHVHLRHSLEMMQRFITTLPSHETTVLSREQGTIAPVEAGLSLYEAIV